MKVLSVILGVLVIIAGVICLFSPGETFLAAGLIVAIMLLVYGIVGIINVITKRSLAITLFASIPAVIIGIIALTRPGSTLALDIVLAYMFAAWFVVMGIVNIITSIQTKSYAKGWVFSLIFGIIAVIVGIYSFIHPQISALAIGILIGIYLIEAGIDIIVLGTVAGRIDDAINDIDNKSEQN